MNLRFYESANHRIAESANRELANLRIGESENPKINPRGIKFPRKSPNRRNEPTDQRIEELTHRWTIESMHHLIDESANRLIAASKHQ